MAITEQSTKRAQPHVEEGARTPQHSKPMNKRRD